MPIDITSDVLAALRYSESRAIIADAVRAVVREEIRTALAEQQETLQPLGDILGLRPDSARKRIARDPGLRAIGVGAVDRLDLDHSMLTARASRPDSLG